MKILNENERLKQYLLGNLAADQMEAIDLQLISDEDFEENLIIAENNLIEDFLEGELTSAEIDYFHKNFLISNDRKTQVDNVRQIKQYAGTFDFEKNSDELESEPNDNFFRRLSQTFSMQLVRAFAVIFIVGLTGSLIWFGFFYKTVGLDPLETEFAKLNKEDFSDLAKYKGLSRLILLNGNTRGSDESNELLREKLTEDVLLNLALRTDSKEVEFYTVELIKNKKAIFTQPDIRTYKNEVGQELRFIIPSKILELGQYQIILTSNSDANNKLVYSFTVK